jgi:hypothetical protein
MANQSFSTQEQYLKKLLLLSSFAKKLSLVFSLLPGVGSSQCNQVVKVSSDRTEVVELNIPPGKCTVIIEALKGRIALQLKGIMMPCDDQSITVFEATSNFPLTR